MAAHPALVLADPLPPVRDGACTEPGPPPRSDAIVCDTPVVGPVSLLGDARSLRDDPREYSVEDPGPPLWPLGLPVLLTLGAMTTAVGPAGRTD